jgi:hypothetical protein
MLRIIVEVINVPIYHLWMKAFNDINEQEELKILCKIKTLGFLSV